MPIDQTKVEEFVATYKDTSPTFWNKPVDPNGIIYQGSRWHTLEQFGQMAAGEDSRGYTFPSMSHTTGDISRNKEFSHSKPGAEELQRMARAAGLNCDIIASGGMHGAQTQYNYGTWHLNLHGRETLEALSAAGLDSAIDNLRGREKS